MREKPGSERALDGSIPRILVVGPRRGLIRALDEFEFPYVVWTDRNAAYSGAQYVHRAHVAVGDKLARREAEALREHGPFTHVIAGGEYSVVSASAARRVLGARQSSHSTVIRCRDKLKMKTHLESHGIPMTSFLPGSTALDRTGVVQRLGLPVVAKLRSQSGGRGIEIIRGTEALPRVMRRRFILERFVDAREMSVESFVNRGRILFESTTEYTRKAHVNVVPAVLEPSTREAVLDINRRVIRALDVTWGMTHAEFYLTPRGVLFGEIALRPPGGYIMDLLRLAWGFDSWRAFVSVEIDRPFDFPVEQAAHSSAMIFHPGAGTVKTVHGLNDVCGHEATIRASMRVVAGDRIDGRAGVGNDVGHVLLRAASRAKLFEALEFVDKHLQIELEGVSRNRARGA